MYASTHRAWVAPGSVYTTKATAALGVSTTQGPELHLELSGNRSLCWFLAYLHYRYSGLCCSLTSLHCSCLCGSSSCLQHSTWGLAAPGCVWTKVACMCCSYWGVYTTGTWAVDGCVYTREPVLLLEESTLQHKGLSCILTCLDSSSLCRSCTDLHYRCLCWHSELSTHCAWASPELVFTTESGAAPGWVSSTSPKLNLVLSGQQLPACAALRLICIH